MLEICNPKYALTAVLRQPGQITWQPGLLWAPKTKFSKQYLCVSRILWSYFNNTLNFVVWSWKIYHWDTFTLYKLHTAITSCCQIAQPPILKTIIAKLRTWVLPRGFSNVLQTSSSVNICISLHVFDYRDDNFGIHQYK